MDPRTELPLYVFAPIVFLVILGAPIWFSVKTRPVGPLRYRWGTFVGFQGLLVAVIAFRYTAVAFAQDVGLGAWLIATFTLLAVVAGVGIIRRKRWGVVSLIVVQSSLILATLFRLLFPEALSP
jgi:hypothetical protein